VQAQVQRKPQQQQVKDSVQVKPANKRGGGNKTAPLAPAPLPKAAAAAPQQPQSSKASTRGTVKGSGAPTSNVSSSGNGRSMQGGQAVPQAKGVSTNTGTASSGNKWREVPAVVKAPPAFSSNPQQPWLAQQQQQHKPQRQQRQQHQQQRQQQQQHMSQQVAASMFNSSSSSSRQQGQQQVPIGLSNGDNRCWLIAMLQLLFGVPELVGSLKEAEGRLPRHFDRGDPKAAAKLQGATTLRLLNKVLQLASTQRTTSWRGCALDKAIVNLRMWICQCQGWESTTQECSYMFFTALMAHLAVSPSSSLNQAMTAADTLVKPGHILSLVLRMLCISGFDAHPA
jgi:hypothetical protein